MWKDKRAQMNEFLVMICADRFHMADEALKTTSLMVSQGVVQNLRDKMPNLVNHSKLSNESLVTSVAQLLTAYLAPNNSRMLKTNFSETAMYLIVRSSNPLTAHIWII